MARLRLDAVDKRYRGAGRSIEALCGVSLDVADGSCTAILGPSGCGKTTLLRVIAGLETPDAGRVLFDGHDVTREPVARRGVGMVFQHDALFPHLSAFANIAYGLAKRGLSTMEIDARVRDAAGRMRAGDVLSRSARTLSGGERQRVAVARALAPSPAIVLLDEPFSRLDAPLRSELRVELRGALRATRATAVFVTHDQAEAMALADRIAVVRAGRIEQIASPRVLYDAPATTFVAAFVGWPAMSFVPRDAVPFAAEVREAATFGFRADAIHVSSDGTVPGIVRALEDFGADAYAHVETAVGTLVVRGEPNALPREGERVTLGFDRARAHPFDAAGIRMPELARV